VDDDAELEPVPSKKPKLDPATRERAPLKTLDKNAKRAARMGQDDNKPVSQKKGTNKRAREESDEDDDDVVKVLATSKKQKKEPVRKEPGAKQDDSEPVSQPKQKLTQKRPLEELADDDDVAIEAAITSKRQKMEPTPSATPEPAAVAVDEVSTTSSTSEDALARQVSFTPPVS
jgi:hypothetical protein